MCSCMCLQYLTIVNPATSNSDGLVSCLRSALADRFDIDISKKDSVLIIEGKAVLIGDGSDQVLMERRIPIGMKAQMQETQP